MTTEVQKFDPSALMDGVKQRIKATFISLIPDDHWEALCKREVDSFFEERRRDRNYEHISDFQKVCQEELVILSREKIKEFLEDYESNTFKNGEPNLSGALGELIVKMAPEIFAATFGNMFQNAVNNMKRY